MLKPIDVTFTKEGFEKLKKEHEELIIRRPQVLARLVAAREQGDLSENAGYHASKEELAHVDRRIRELRLLLKYGQIADMIESDQVQVGSKVKVSNGLDTFEYWIVGKLEADPAHGKLSEVSPIGGALIGKKVSDEVEVETPDGQITYKILGIK